MRKPEEGDLLLACCDAMIAAQTAVLAAESLGIGSCYIGDIMENNEAHKELFQLPKYVIPIGLLCFGHPTQAQKEREKTSRFGEDFIHFIDRYRRLDEDEFNEMYAEMHEQRMTDQVKNAGIKNVGELMYTRKLGSD
jgi:FMN reductase (NADPH)/FMN reductase [NAD(P)H]